MFPAMFELEPGHRNRRKSTRFGRWLTLATACRSAGACALAEDARGVGRPGRPPTTVASASHPRVRSHVSGEQVALAGALLGDAKDSAGPGPPTGGVFPPPGPGTSASAGAEGGTRCRRRLRHVLFNPSNPTSPGGSGAAGDALLLEQTPAVLLGLYFKTQSRAWLPYRRLLRACIRLSSRHQPPPSPRTAGFVSETAVTD